MMVGPVLAGDAGAETQTFSECSNIRPYSALTCQPGRGVLRVMESAGAGAAKTGPFEPGNKGTIVDKSYSVAALGVRIPIDCHLARHIVSIVSVMHRSV